MKHANMNVCGLCARKITKVRAMGVFFNDQPIDRTAYPVCGRCTPKLERGLTQSELEALERRLLSQADEPDLIQKASTESCHE
jgi:hypothetical protein